MNVIYWNVFHNIAKFFGETKTISIQEVMRFWDSLTEKEKDFYFEMFF